MRILLLLFLLPNAVRGIAQETIPFDFTSEDENRLVRENDSCKFYVATTDTNNTVVLNEESSYYKLLNKDRKLIAEGAFIVDGDKFLQDGKWTARYANGTMKNTGYYRRSVPMGTWQSYYNSGKIKTICNYGIFVYKGDPGSCLSGTWQEFYPDGKLKVNGFYCGILYTYKDTVEVEDPVSGSKVVKVVTRSEMRSEKTGHWEYFTETGDLDKRDDY